MNNATPGGTARFVIGDMVAVAAVPWRETIQTLRARTTESTIRVMTDLTAKAPFNPEKHSELHDQTKIAPPGPPTRDWLKRFWPIGLSIVLAIGIISLAFIARAGWTNHREWVVAINVPPLVLGAVAIANLVYRGRWNMLVPGVIVLFLCTLLSVLNIWRGYQTEGQDNLRDAMSIIQGILLAISLHLLIGAWIWNEWKNPMKAPEPNWE